MSITAKELAARLGLSEAAISLALNNKPGVSTATRKRVVAAAEELGYDFSRRATETAVAPQGTINFVIYKKHGAVVTDTPFFSELTVGIDLACKKYHYYMNILYIYDEENIASQLASWKRIGCVGIILLGTEMQRADLEPFLNCGIPVVLLDNYFEDCDIDCILINNVTGAYTATNYLIRKRKTQPGYLHSSYSINNFEERADGFYKAIRHHGMSSSRSIVHKVTPSVDGAYSDMKVLLQNNEPIADCYFADNDLIAAGAVKAFREAGYRVPKDVAVVGFDNMPICTYFDPPLTTVHVPKQYMSLMAVSRLHEIIGSADHHPIKIEISTKLQKRESC